MMGEYFVLMNIRRSIPLIGGVGCLLVFDSLESLREISPHGEYVKIENINVEKQ